MMKNYKKSYDFNWGFKSGGYLLDEHGGTGFYYFML